ncbi:MAG: nucleotide disphospho-sugar-binding domain-containing protein [Gammaproteobacteria bacterium]
MLPYVDIVNILLERNHDVIFIARDIEKARQVFKDININLRAAPVSHRQTKNPVLKPVSYTHVLNNIGFNDSDMLATQIRAWHETLIEIKPDLLVFEHSPTAMLAASVFRCKKLMLGTGFTVPSAEIPMPPLYGDSEKYRNQLLVDDKNMLDIVNRALKQCNFPQLIALSDLFDENEQLLLTLPELDHYQNRRNGKYQGIALPASYGTRTEWKSGSVNDENKPRVFAYLHTETSVRLLAEVIMHTNAEAILHGPSDALNAVPDQALHKICLAAEPVTMEMILTECDIVVTNGSHATTALSLLFGKPVAVLSSHFEQALNGMRVAALNCGIHLPLQQLDSSIQLSRFIQQPAIWQDAAENFSQGYVNQGGINSWYGKMVSQRLADTVCHGLD